jgi:hypothetical protein
MSSVHVTNVVDRLEPYNVPCVPIRTSDDVDSLRQTPGLTTPCATNGGHANQINAKAYLPRRLQGA